MGFLQSINIVVSGFVSTPSGIRDFLTFVTRFNCSEALLRVHSESISSLISKEYPKVINPSDKFLIRNVEFSSKKRSSKNLYDNIRY